MSTTPDSPTNNISTMTSEERKKSDAAFQDFLNESKRADTKRHEEKIQEQKKSD